MGIEAQLAINSIGQIKQALDDAAQSVHEDGFNIWWRGVSSFDFDLIPSAFRQEASSDSLYGNLLQESAALRRFRQYAPQRYSHLPALEDYAGWTFLAQHYGLPTRVLDWSESFLIALYFAAFDYGVDGAVWALNPLRLNHQQVGSSFVSDVSHEESRQVISLPFEYDPNKPEWKDFAENNRGGEKIIAVKPRLFDVRMQAQFAGFTAHGTLTPLNFLPGAENYLMKFRVSGAAKQALQKDLYRLGVRESVLFPDLEHLAQEVRRVHFHLGLRQDIGEQH